MTLINNLKELLHEYEYYLLSIFVNLFSTIGILYIMYFGNLNYQLDASLMVIYSFWNYFLINIFLNVAFNYIMGINPNYYYFQMRSFTISYLIICLQLVYNTLSDIYRDDKLYQNIKNMNFKELQPEIHIFTGYLTYIGLVMFLSYCVIKTTENIFEDLIWIICNKHQNGQAIYIPSNTVFIGNECVICFKNKPSMLNLPCGHVIACHDCYQECRNMRIRKCCFCREDISLTMSIKELSS